MNNVSNLVRRAFLLLVATTNIAYGYEVETHRDLTRRAVLASDLEAAVERIGLASTRSVLPNNVNDFALRAGTLSSVYCFDAFGPGQRSIMDLVRLGAFCEDATAGTQQLGRYAMHFYDPAHDGVGYRGGAFPSSLNWGLESGDIGTQDYSYKDAKNYLYNGIIAPAHGERLRNLSLTFRTIGHVVHLIQDLAQPQHTRNDSHGSGSLFESYTDGVRADLPFTGYGPVRFAMPREFWHTADGKGLADYSNKGFVSAGTNFAGSASNIRSNPGYPEPDGTGAVISRVSIADLRNEPECHGAAIPLTLTGDLRFIGTPVVDRYADRSAFNPRTSTFSLFDEDLKHYVGLDAVFTLNRFNFCEAHKLLIPRAVAYSAGLINYFFRGQLEISAPDEGVYGVVDHVVENQPNGGGFQRVKLKLRNVTSAGTGPDGEALVEPIPATGGALAAVAKFHRNLCYQPNLSGEYGSPGLDWRVCRSPTEEIVVSDSITALGGINQQAQPFTFTFRNKIPIEATDLFLQVVYRGPLGEEADAVVVATKDISEPTYVHQFATADQYLYCSNGVISSTPPCEQKFTFKQSFCEQLHPELTYDQCKARYGSGLKFRANPAASPIPGYDPANPAFPPGEWVNVASEPPFVPAAQVAAVVGTFARVAVLTDVLPSVPFLFVTEDGVGAIAQNFQWSPGTLPPTINQVDPATGNMTVNRQYAQARGVYVDTTPFPSNPEINAYVLLSSGNASPIPNLTLVQSQVNF